MKKHFFVFFAFFCVSSVFADNVLQLEKELSDSGFERKLDENAFRKIIETGTPAIRMPEENFVIVCHQGWKERKRLNNFARDYIDQVEEMLKKREYPVAVERIRDWLVLAHFADVTVLFPNAMLKKIYPYIASASFPSEQRKNIVEMSKKYFLPIARETYNTSFVNAIGQNITGKNRILLYCWFQATVLDCIADDGTLDAAKLTQAMSQLLASVGEQDGAKCKYSASEDGVFTADIEFVDGEDIFHADSKTISHRRILPEIPDVVVHD